MGGTARRTWVGIGAAVVAYVALLLAVGWLRSHPDSVLWWPVGAGGLAYFVGAVTVRLRPGDRPADVDGATLVHWFNLSFCIAAAGGCLVVAVLGGASGFIWWHGLAGAAVLALGLVALGVGCRDLKRWVDAGAAAE